MGWLRQWIENTEVFMLTECRFFQPDVCQLSNKHINCLTNVTLRDGIACLVSYWHDKTKVMSDSYCTKVTLADVYKALHTGVLCESVRQILVQVKLNAKRELVRHKIYSFFFLVNRSTIRVKNLNELRFLISSIS